ncbi:MAG: hypothetical protein AMJ64_09855 [Betaproteobacteria bacterium SG8_39]|nr:MAG: hypothetical protein AMJ64_09855 [Betaproteobacteria bacterium SG8_39]
MGQAEYVYPTGATLERHIGRINAARRASAVLEAVRAYLGSWPTERVERLQCADAGWAPFDAHQHPLARSGDACAWAAERRVGHTHAQP